MQYPPRPIKLLAIDIDGTLLNPQKEITPRVVAAVKAARQAGVIVTLATARRYIGSMPFADQLGIEIPLITHDGALIIHHPHRKVIHTHLLANEIARQGVEIMVRHGVQPAIHYINGCDEEIWTGLAEFDNQEVSAYLKTAPDSVRRLAHGELCVADPEPLRVVAFGAEEVIYGMIAEISTLPCLWYAIKRGNYGCAEIVIMPTNCTKASGISALARHLEIPLEQVMAIGDNTNDIEILQAVGWGVAMGQAPDVVKAAADAVTASNTEDGVALAIERYILRSDAPYTSSNSRNRATCL